MARSCVLSVDFSEGKEAFPIRVVNDVDEDTSPAFEYLKNIDLMIKDKSFKECHCLDNCSSSCPCSIDIYKGNAATVGKLEKLITECGPSCSCLGCANKLTQKPLIYSIEIFRTVSRGWGCRATMDIPRGSFIGEYTGTIERDIEGSHADANGCQLDGYRFETEAGDESITINAAFCGNFTRFINHSCNANVFAARVRRGGNLFEHTCIFSLRKICKGEELSINYGDTWWHNMEDISCKCGSTVCRFK